MWPSAQSVERHETGWRSPDQRRSAAQRDPLLARLLMHQYSQVLGSRESTVCSDRVAEDHLTDAERPQAAQHSPVAAFAMGTLADVLCDVKRLYVLTAHVVDNPHRIGDRKSQRCVVDGSDQFLRPHEHIQSLRVAIAAAGSWPDPATTSAAAGAPAMHDRRACSPPASAPA